MPELFRKRTPLQVTSLRLMIQFKELTSSHIGFSKNSISWNLSNVIENRLKIVYFIKFINPCLLKLQKYWKINSFITFQNQLFIFTPSNPTLTRFSRPFANNPLKPSSDFLNHFKLSEWFFRLSFSVIKNNLRESLEPLWSAAAGGVL